jgi:non-homologous end joining protein Ku
MEEDKVVDLMAALEASVQSAKAARQRHPAGADDDGKAKPAKAAKKAPAKKARKSA